MEWGAWGKETEDTIGGGDRGHPRGHLFESGHPLWAPQLWGKALEPAKPKEPAALFELCEVGRPGLFPAQSW